MSSSEMSIATIQHALWLASEGMQVLPIWGVRDNKCLCADKNCPSPGKHPIGALVPNWRAQATTDEATIRQWWSRFPDANVGLATGGESGVMVVDLDLYKHSGVQQAWEDLCLEHGQPDDTVTVATGSGGLHVWFAIPHGWTVPNSSSRIASGIDVRGDGGYVLVPPSLHTSGRHYSWHIGPGDAPVAVAPDWLLELAGAKSLYDEGPSVPSAVPAVATRPVPVLTEADIAYSVTAIESELAALSRAPQGTRNKALTEATCRLSRFVYHGAITEGELHKRIRNAFPLAPGESPQKEVDGPFRSSLRHALRNPAPLRSTDNYRIALPEPIERPRVEEPAPHSKAANVPDDLPVLPDGPLRLAYDWIMSSATLPQPAITTHAVLGAFAAMAGRNYRTPSGLRTNVQLVSLAPTGSGKDHPRRKVNELLNTLGFAERIGPEHIASGQAIVSALTNSQEHTCFFQIDEFGKALGSSTNGKSSAQQSLIIQMFLELFSLAQGVFTGVARADVRNNPATRIPYPWFGYHGYSTPSTFYSALTSSDIASGLFPRILVVDAGSNHPEINPRNRDTAPVPPELFVWGDAVRSGVQEAQFKARPSGRFDLRADQPPPLIDVGVSEFGYEDAVVYLYGQQVDKAKRLAGTPAEDIWTRFGEHVWKIALVLAVAANPKAPVIDGSVMEWARVYVSRCLEFQQRVALEEITDNDAHRLQQEIYKFVFNAGKWGLTQGALTKKARKLGEQRQRMDALNALLESGEVVQVSGHRSGPGPKPVNLVAATYLAED